MQDKASKYLLDALQACEAIVDFTRGISLRPAVERQFEILGEALNRLDHIVPEYKQQHPEVGDIIGMRNRIIHGYDSVDDAIVWDALQNHLPQLMTWLQTFSFCSE
ncbi:MAG: DUF86 domain-containing protein [Desulfosudaceae bacterium]